MWFRHLAKSGLVAPQTPKFRGNRQTKQEEVPTQETRTVGSDLEGEVAAADVFELGEAKVGHLDVKVLVHKQVSRLQIAMQYPLSVVGGEGEWRRRQSAISNRASSTRPPTHAPQTKTLAQEQADKAPTIR